MKYNTPTKERCGNMLRVAVAGCYSTNKPYEEAELTAIVSALRALSPGIEITVFSHGRRKTDQLPEVRTANRWNPFRLVYSLLHADMVLSEGNIRDDQGIWPLISHFGILALARFFGKPVVSYGQGVGPLKSLLGRKLVRSACNKIDLITVRDGLSKEILLEIGVDHPPVVVTADPVFTINPAQFDRELGRTLLDRIRSQSLYDSHDTCIDGTAVQRAIIENNAENAADATKENLGEPVSPALSKATATRTDAQNNAAEPDEEAASRKTDALGKKAALNKAIAPDKTAVSSKATALSKTTAPSKVTTQSKEAAPSKTAASNKAATPTKATAPGEATASNKAAALSLNSRHQAAREASGGEALSICEKQGAPARKQEASAAQQGSAIQASTTAPQSAQTSATVKDSDAAAGEQRPLLGVILQNIEDNEQYKKTIASAADRLVQDGWEVLFIPFDFAADIHVCQEVSWIMQQKNLLLKEKLSLLECFSLLGELDLLLGMKLSALKMASVMRTPCVGVALDNKISRFLEMTGQTSAGTL
ncbi:MAG: polysaccharide pyruvyl transferase family protein, partial [Acetomicrobium sp.]